MINNTFISSFEDDLYLFTEASSTCHLLLVNNVFAGPSRRFLERNGQGTITGSHNWFPTGTAVPDTLTDSTFGDDPGFVDLKAHDFHLRPDSPLINAGLAAPEYLGESGQPVAVIPEYEPTRESAWPGLAAPTKRARCGPLDIGAFEHVFTE